MNLLNQKPHRQVIELALVEYQAGSQKMHGVMPCICGADVALIMACKISKQQLIPVFGAN